MILNTKIFNQAVETARIKSATKPAILRAIDRAVNEINRSRYWAYDSTTNVLKLKSTTSNKLYVIDDAHTCDAQSKFCKHIIARRLMQRYTEALGVTSTEGERIAAAAPMAWSAAGEQTAQGWKVRDEETLKPAAPQQTIDVFRGHPRGVARKQRWDWHREF